MEWWQRCGSNEGGHGNSGRGSRRPSERWGCRSIPLRHGQSRSYTTNPSASLFLSPYFALPQSPSSSLPSRSLCHPATLPPCSVFPPPLTVSLSFSLASWYVRTIANGLQPLPGIYPRNLPERPSNSAASSRVRAHPTLSLRIPRGDLPTARSLNNETPFPRLRLNSRPEEARSASLFRANVPRAFMIGRLSTYLFLLSPSDALSSVFSLRDFRTLTFLPPSTSEIDLR